MKKKIFIFLAVIFILPACSKKVNEILFAPYSKSHVFLIGLDAWGGYSFEKSDMPVVEEVIANGAHTFKAIDEMPSVTIVNWASMFMGATPDEHGYHRNDDAIREPPYTHTDEYGSFPSVFTVLKKARPELEVAYFYEKVKIGGLCPDGVIDNKQQLALSYSNSAVETVCDYIKAKKPDFAAIVFQEPDSTGHSMGHDTSQYYDMLKELDAKIAEIIQAIKDAGIWNNTVLILSSDHGGIGYNHGGDTPQEREIPFIISGKNIKKGYEITSDVSICAVAATVVYILGIEPSEHWNTLKARNVQEAFK